jgi:hypothetical protein
LIEKIYEMSQAYFPAVTICPGIELKTAYFDYTKLTTMIENGSLSFAELSDYEYEQEVTFLDGFL